MFRITILIALLFAAVSAAPFWLVQSTFRKANNCELQNLVSTSSWKTEVCLKHNSTHWSLRSCSSKKVISTFCTSSTCTTDCVVSSSFVANKCGSISNGTAFQGVFFGCVESDDPPKVSNQNHNVFDDVVYAQNCSSPVQSLSFVNNACVSNELRKCDCSSGACVATFATPCNAAASTVALSVCIPNVISGSVFTRKLTCTSAIAPTPTPTDPDNQEGADPDSVTSCDKATTEDQCVRYVNTANGKPTLPPTGLLNKCCVWCGLGDGSGGGKCRTPSFSKKLCDCPAEGTRNFTDIVKAYGCDSKTTQAVNCVCTGKPPGAPSCVAANASTVSAVIAMAFMLIAGSFLM